MNQSVDANWQRGQLRAMNFDPNSNMKINDLTDGILSSKKSLMQMKNASKKGGNF
jgi:hypothetical protein